MTDSTIWPRRDPVRWRATPEEQRMRLPGDEPVPAPLLQITRAVMIDVPPQQTDPRSRRRFAVYWVVVGPLSGLIRRLVLRRLAIQVEHE